MTSDTNYQEAYVWIWLPGETEPVVAGRLENDGNQLLFNYGRSYLEHTANAIPVFDTELPLKPGVQMPLEGLNIPGCIRDSAPDSWGRRVILNKRFGQQSSATDTAALNELVYLLESGSDRIGALDFQQSATNYLPREPDNVSMEELLSSAQRVEQGVPLTPELDLALFHGTAIGGARPKALIQDNHSGDDKKYIAKFSSSDDIYSVVKAEYIAMRLADLAGLDVAPVRLTEASGKDVLLVERFDRKATPEGWHRKAIVSALTLLELDELMARYASYEKLAEIIRHRFTQPKQTLRELFSRLTFNILCGNTDDHARNHAAFWDGEKLSLTPAYDICPQPRTGNEASQAMLILGNNNLSSLNVCLQAAHNFLLSEREARAIIREQVNVIRENWNLVCDEAELSQVDKNVFWQRQFLNPYCMLR